MGRRGLHRLPGAGGREENDKDGVFETKLMWGYFDLFIGKVRETPRFKGRDISPPEVLAELFPNLRYIWMMRRDKVRQAVSLSRGLQTLVWWKRKSAEAKSKKDTDYDFDAIAYLFQEVVFHEAT